MSIACETEEGEWIYCPLFYGQKLEEWIEAIESFFQKFQIPHIQYANLASHHLQIFSTTVKQYADGNEFWSWSKFKEALREEFNPASVEDLMDLLVVNDEKKTSCFVESEQGSTTISVDLACEGVIGEKFVSKSIKSIDTSGFELGNETSENCAGGSVVGFYTKDPSDIVHQRMDIVSPNEFPPTETSLLLSIVDEGSSILEIVSRDDQDIGSLLYDRYIAQKYTTDVLVNLMSDCILAESGLLNIGCYRELNVCDTSDGYSLYHAMGITNKQLIMLLHASGKYISNAHKVYAIGSAQSKCGCCIQKEWILIDKVAKYTAVLCYKFPVVPGRPPDVHIGQSYSFLSFIDFSVCTCLDMGASFISLFSSCHPTASSSSFYEEERSSKDGFGFLGHLANESRFLFFTSTMVSCSLATTGTIIFKGFIYTIIKMPIQDISVDHSQARNDVVKRNMHCDMNYVSHTTTIGSERSSCDQGSSLVTNGLPSCNFRAPLVMQFSVSGHQQRYDYRLIGNIYNCSKGVAFAIIGDLSYLLQGVYLYVLDINSSSYTELFAYASALQAIEFGGFESRIGICASRIQLEFQTVIHVISNRLSFVGDTVRQGLVGRVFEPGGTLLIMFYNPMLPRQRTQSRGMCVSVSINTSQHIISYKRQQLSACTV